jgi:hypothetical protein
MKKESKGTNGTVEINLSRSRGLKVISNRFKVVDVCRSLTAVAKDDFTE